MRRLLLVLDHADGLVGQVLAQVVAVLGPARRLDVVVVADQVGGPLVGVALQEAVVALEAEAERPGVERPGGRALPARREVPLADGQGRVAGVAQEAGQGGGRLGQSGVVAGEAEGDVGQEAHAHGVVVAPGEEGGPGRRAQGRDVEAVEAAPRPQPGRPCAASRCPSRTSPGGRSRCRRARWRPRSARPAGGLGSCGERGVDSAAVKPICWGSSMAREGRRSAARGAVRRANVARRCRAICPDRPSPTSPRASAPFIGYVATREPRPLDERAPRGARLGGRSRRVRAGRTSTMWASGSRCTARSSR